jgi:hypothetical protein
MERKAPSEAVLKPRGYKRASSNELEPVKTGSVILCYHDLRSRSITQDVRFRVQA